MKAFISVIAVALVGVASSAALPKKTLSIPKYVKTCQRDQSDFNSCLLSSLEGIIPYLSRGISEWDLPPFEPYREEEFITEYVNGLVEGKIVIKDSVAYGLSELKFVDVRSDFTDENNINIQIDVYIPKLTSEGKYKARGTFFGAEYGSQGNYQLSLVNITTTWDIHGKLVTVDGVPYMKVTEFGMTPQVGSMKAHVTDLFGNNPELSRAVISFFNQYWRPIYAELLPYARESWNKIMKSFANRIFLRIPFDQIFPVSGSEI